MVFINNLKVGGLFVFMLSIVGLVFVWCDSYNGFKKSPKTFSNPTPNITLVSAFFFTGKSKHSFHEYEKWMENFLSNVNTPIVIFTQPVISSLISKIRGNKLTHIVLLDDIWEIPWLKKSHKYYLDYHKMFFQDPERLHVQHSPELYAIWNSKPWMLWKATKLNPFNSTYFFWTDIGFVRSNSGLMIKDLNNFPNVHRVKQVFGTDPRSKNYSIFQVFAVNKFPTFKHSPGFNDMISMSSVVIGGFMGGTSVSISWFKETFYKVHDEMLNKGYFVGQDQDLYSWIVLQNPSKFYVVCSCFEKFLTNQRCEKNGWFYFRQWYSGNTQTILNCGSSPLKSMTEFIS